MVGAAPGADHGEIAAVILNKPQRLARNAEAEFHFRADRDESTKRPKVSVMNSLRLCPPSKRTSAPSRQAETPIRTGLSSSLGASLMELTVDGRFKEPIT